MKIAEIKEQMLIWEDFYGGDISCTDRIKKAKTKKELSEILDEHHALMENMLADASSHLSHFKKELGLHLV